MRNKVTTEAVIVLLVMILTICFYTGKLFFSDKKAFSVFNYSFFIVGSSSMEPEYPVRSLIIVKNEAIANLELGDVILYRSDALSGGLAFHRIIKITEEGIYTKGDKNSYEDTQLITQKTYIGKGVYHNYLIGSYFSAIQNPTGFIIFMLLPVSAVLLFNMSIKKLFHNRG